MSQNSDYMSQFYAALEKRKKKNKESNIVVSSDQNTNDDYMSQFYAALEKRQEEAEEKIVTKPFSTVGSLTSNKDEEDIAPVKDKEDDSKLDFFKKSEGNVAQAILGTVGDAGLGIVKGLGRLGEGLGDLISYGGAAVADALGKDYFAESVRKRAQESYVDKVFGGATDYVDQYSVLGRTSDAILEGVGQVGGIIATGGLGSAAGLSSGAVTALTTGTMGLSGMGSGMGEAYQAGATDGEAVAYGAISGAADALSELIFGGLGKAVNAVGLSKGLSSADDILAKNVSGLFSKQLAKNIAEYGIKAGAEGFEEVIAGTAQAIGKKLTYMSEEELGKIVADENLLEQFVVGAVTSGIAQAPSLHVANKTGTDFITGYNQNEQAVIKKEVENRIAEKEKNGTKLTAKEKSAIEAQVERDLEKGYISTETIESVLGDSTAYDSLLKESEEFNTLYETATGELSKKQQDRLAELEAKNKANPYKDALETAKSQYSQSVRDRVNGSRLAESYNEIERKKQDFQADYSKFEGAKHQDAVKQTLESAIKAGANNTNRVHDIVDFAAKIAGDTGKSFDFKDAEQIKADFIERQTKLIAELESLENRNDVQNEKLAQMKDVLEKVKSGETTVNGSVSENGIVLNLDSGKPLNRIVGHEITHVFEPAKGKETKEYTALRDTLYKYAKAKNIDVDQKLAEYKALYEGLEADAEREMIADMVGDFLFSDIDFVNHLSVENRNLFQKIYDEIKYMLKVATAGSKEARELERVKKAFEDIYRANEKSAENTNYSLENGNKRKYNKRSWYSQSETEFMRWERGSTPVGEVKRFVRFGKTHYYEKTENGCVELSKSQYNERKGINVEKSYRRAESRLGATVDYDENTQRGLLGDPDGYRDANGNAAVFGQALSEKFQHDTAGSESSTVGYNSRNDINQSEYNEEASDNPDASFITFSNDYAAIRNRMKDGDTGEKYSLSTVESVQPKSDKWHRTATTEEAMARFPNMWNVAAEESEVRNPTQITSTVKSYRKIYNFLKDEGFNGTILDASSGLGYGTKAGIEEYGFNVEDIEPYPDKGYKPKYTDYSTLDKKYDVIISNAVLNVLPQDQRDALAIKMGELLKDGGRMFINVRGKDVESLANTGKNIHLGNMEWIETVKGSYQKGFTKDELKAYLEDALGDGFTVEKTNMFGAVSVVVTKNGDVKYSLSDSSGRKLTNEQQEYFKDSSVRDEDGNLLVLYHGTQNDFTVFDIARSGENYDGWSELGEGIYLTPRKESAQYYGDNAGWGREVNLMEVYANIKNLFNTQDAVDFDISDLSQKYELTEYDERFMKKAGYRLVDFLKHHNESVRDYLTGKGYDGVWEKDLSGYVHQVVAYSENQIKNTDNVTPTTNPDIRYSLSAETDKAYLDAVNRGDMETVQKMVDDYSENAGFTVRGHHGTTNLFFVFDTDKSNIENDWGRGIYATTSDEDAQVNYASDDGADLTNRIERLAEMMENWEEYEDMDYEQRVEAARKQLSQGANRMLHVAYRMENPVVVERGKGGTFFTYESEYNEETDEYSEPSGTLIDVVERMQDIIYEDYEWASYDADKLVNLYEEAIDFGGLSALELQSSVSDWLADVTDEDGNLAGNEILRAALEQMGYDGIIDKSVPYKFGELSGKRYGGMRGVVEGTTHYIAFNSSQVKLTDPVTYDDNGNVIPLSERFNPNNKDIRNSLSNTGNGFSAYAPIRENEFFGQDFGKQEEVAPVAENAPAAEIATQDLFPNDLAPAESELSSLIEERTALEETLLEMVENGNVGEEFNRLSEQWDSINQRAIALENELLESESGRIDSLTDSDVPPEMDAHYAGEASNQSVPDPFADRDMFDVGNKKVKAYMYENPEVKPFFQDAALGMLDDLHNGTKGEKWFNGDVYYESGGEKGWGGTKRTTTPDIADLLDNWHYTYDQIDKGLNAIIEDNGKENNAVSKRIEFMLDYRLRNGYTGVWGEKFPPDQGYINLLKEKQINEYSEEAFNRFMENADQYAPIAPVAEEAPVAPVTTEAPVKEQYESVTPKRAKEPKMVRVDTAKAEQVARVLVDEPATNKKKTGLWSLVKEYVLDNGMVFEDLSKKTKNRNIEAKWNFVRYARGMAQHLMESGADGVKSLKSIMDEANATGKTEAFFEYLYHMHNVDRMSLEGRYEGVSNKAVFGDSVTAEMSRAFASDLAKENPEFRRMAQDVYRYNAHLRQLLVDGGVISQETADLWAEMYPHYVPIRRAGHSDLSINVPLDTKKTGVNAPVKRATGGSSDILNLFDTMGQRTIQTLTAVAKNRFGVELKNALGSTVDSSMASVDEVIDSIDTHEELLQAGKNGMSPTFTVFENGEKVTFEITEEMYQAMRPTSDLLSHTIKPLNVASNIHRGLLTEYNPVFMITNAIKDAQDVLINSQHPLKTYAKFPMAVKELTGKGKWYNEYMENGGEHNSYFDTDTNTFQEENKVLEGIKKWTGLGAISNANNFIERVPRLAEYIASREAGRSIEESMLDAARVTTNFAAGGKLTKALNRNGFTFLNASMQGAVQQVRNIREAKMNGLRGTMTLAAKFAVAGLIPALLNGLLWEDDEEYEELSDYVKDNYYIVAKYGDGQFVRIPKGRTTAVIQSAFDQMGNLITGNDEVDLKRFGELLISNLAPNNPLDNNIIAPIKQALTNTTWYGDDLVPTRLQDLPAAEQYDETTDSISRWLGEKAGEIGIDISPVKINYLLDQYTGGVGDTILPMLTPAAESGDNTFVGNLLAPFKDKFTTDSVLKNQNVSDFYEKVDELALNANKSGATDEDILMSKYMNSASASIGQLYGDKRKEQNTNLPDDQKYQMVRGVQQDIVDAVKNALGSYEDVTINGDYATVGDMYFQKKDGEWQKMSKDQVSKYNATSKAGDAPYATDGNNHYRYYTPEGETEAEWRKLTDEQVEKQKKVTSGLGITPEEYWGNKEEYDYAYENPENYAVAKAVGGYESYRTYSSELDDIKADKDKNGKSISGSRKEKVFDYVFSLNIDEGMKLVLLKSEYNADDSFNYEIIEYLNGRDDLSYEEKVTVFKKIGFNVDSNGYITW